MYVSLAQITTSLQRLQEVHPFFGYAFLGFKKRGLPIGSTTEFSYKFIKDEILDRYFRIEGQPGYFNPFKSNRQWVSERYESTSLQRIIADTFSPAFIHAKTKSKWGWKLEYVVLLRELMHTTKTRRIPLVDLAVWLYRKVDFQEKISQDLLQERFCQEFGITKEELAMLFDSTSERRSFDTSRELVTDIELLNQIGWPSEGNKESGLSLKRLKLINVGPAETLEYEPARRINIITGDNSLGKTFLLNCAWWSMTGDWIDYTADPYSDVRRRSRSEINYTLASQRGREQTFIAPYNLLENVWQRPRQPINGLVLYTDFTGGYALWDPSQIGVPGDRTRKEAYLNFSRDEVWDGLESKDSRGKSKPICNGLVRDWITWQRGSKDDKVIYSAFEASLAELSPPDGPNLRAGNPVKIAGDAREIPTVRMPYGNVPVLYASAGIQRALSLAYMLVWSWHRHLEQSKREHREPVRTMVLMVDEIECHLHPRWQRQIIPALMQAIESLHPEVTVQLHISSHSPLVLASLEPLYDADRESWSRLSEQILRVDKWSLCRD